MNITRHSLSQLRLHNYRLRGYRTPARLTIEHQSSAVLEYDGYLDNPLAVDHQSSAVLEYDGYLDNPLAVDLATSKVLIGSAYCRILAKHAWRPHDYC